MGENTYSRYSARPTSCSTVGCVPLMLVTTPSSRSKGTGSISPLMMRCAIRAVWRATRTHHRARSNHGPAHPTPSHTRPECSRIVESSQREPSPLGLLQPGWPLGRASHDTRRGAEEVTSDCCWPRSDLGYPGTEPSVLALVAGWNTSRIAIRR